MTIERHWNLTCQIKVSFAEYRLFYRALLQERPTILRGLLIVATSKCTIGLDVHTRHRFDAGAAFLECAHTPQIPVAVCAHFAQECVNRTPIITNSVFAVRLVLL